MIEDLEASGARWLKYFQDLELIEKGQNVLDYGASVGRVAIPFNTFANVTAVDGNPGMVKNLKENEVDANLGSDFTPVMDRRFDFIITNYVLQHNDVGAVQNITRQMFQITNKLFFTYPTYENYCPDAKSYMYYKDAEKLDLLDSHKTSRVMSESELPVLFEKADCDPSTIHRVNVPKSNLYCVTT